MDMDVDTLRYAPPSARALAGVSRATWSRWLSGKSRVPTAVHNLLKILSGDLAHAGGTWAGWKLHEGKLYDPSGVAHTPGGILAWHWTRQELQWARSTENTASDADNVIHFPGRRSAHVITAELHRRLGD